MGLFQDADRDTHIFGQFLTTAIVLHHTTSSVVLAVPQDLSRGCVVEAQAEGWFVLPHLAGDIVTTSKLICKALAFLVEDQATNTTQGLSCEELNLGIRIVGLHKTCRVNLNPLEVHRLGSDGFPHLDAISS